jgi:hypothetical protein
VTGLASTGVLTRISNKILFSGQICDGLKFRASRRAHVCWKIISAGGALIGVANLRLGVSRAPRRRDARGA